MKKIDIFKYLKFRNLLLVDLVMYEDLNPLINKFKKVNKEGIFNIYVSREWKMRLKNNHHINNIFHYKFRGSVSSLVNLKFIANNLKFRYNLIIINSDNKLEYLKYFILNLFFLRKKRVIITTNQAFYELLVFDYLKLLFNFIGWLFFLSIELIVCFILLSYLLLINRIKKLTICILKR